MSEAKHTPGPWRCVNSDGKFLASETKWSADWEGKATLTSMAPILAKKRTVALAVNIDKNWDDETAQNNALRIVAAANACDGIPTEALNAGVVADLLKSLKEIIAITDRKHNVWDKAKAVIAKAEGEPRP